MSSAPPPSGPATASPHDAYENPLSGRYASREMVRIFSARFRFGTWRRLWHALAASEHELGLPVSAEAVEELAAHLEPTDAELDRAGEHERELRHDVMAHVHTLRESCPKAGRIVHLGATSCFVTDNSELVQQQAALELLRSKLLVVIERLAAFAERERARPTVGWTHFQTAQFTTVGKRAGLWLQDFVDDYEELGHVLERLRFRGVKGTTGTQDSFLKLFEGDHDKVERLDRRVAERMGFSDRWPLTGQTYPRRQDAKVLGALTALAASVGKMGSDMRLLGHLKEVEEPFGKKQIGSSAMPYKRNPMRSERMCALSRWLIEIAGNGAHTAATQWLERTLDDSANRRLALSEAFLTADALLELAANVSDGLVVQEEVIARRVEEELPFIASEEVLMEAVRAGGDRQDLHEVIREAAFATAAEVKRGEPNRLFERLAAHAELGPALERIRAEIRPERFTGRAQAQVESYLAEVVRPLLAAAPKREVDAAGGGVRV